jgi:hypothetical protein
MYPPSSRACLQKRFIALVVASLLTVWAGSTLAAQPVDQPVDQPAGEPDRPQDAPGATGDAGYDEGFFLQSEDGAFRLEFAGRLQTQYEAVVTEVGDDLELAQSRFLIRRARLKLSGHAFTKRLTYVFQTDFSGGDTDLLDYYLNYQVAPGTFEGRVGQWRLPFLREEITSSGSLLLVDRSLVTDVFGEGFDVGVAAHNDYTDAPSFEWVVGIFNGTQSKLGAIAPDDPYAPTLFFPTLVARVGYNHGDIDPYKEGDLEGGPLRFAVGASGLTQLGVEREGQSAMKATVDYVLKIDGFSTSGAYMIASAQDGEGLLDQDQLVTGLYAQAGYLIGEMFQPAARYSRVAYDGDGPLVHEALGGLNLYFYGHSLKWQTDAGAIITERDNDTETAWQARTQIQLSF